MQDRSFPRAFRCSVWLPGIILLLLLFPALGCCADPAPARCQVAPTLNTPVEAGADVLWCATLQLAWDRLRRDVINAPIKLDGDYQTVQRLNAAHIKETDLPAGCYFTAAGFANKAFLKKAQEAFTKSFPDEALPEFLQVVNEQDILAYAYLSANGKFSTPFVEEDFPIQFVNTAGLKTQVKVFGLDTNIDYAKARDQVRVLYYASKSRKADDKPADEFIVDLCRDSEIQVILACLAPKKTLADTIADAKTKMAEWVKHHRPDDEKLTKDESLLVPYLSYLDQEQHAIIAGRNVLNPGFTGYRLNAFQKNAFTLDHSGISLKSKANMVLRLLGTTIDGLVMPPIRSFVFDRPFLVLLQMRKAEQPFFALWVENCTMMREDKPTPVEEMHSIPAVF